MKKVLALTVLLLPMLAEPEAPAMRPVVSAAVGPIIPPPPPQKPTGLDGPPPLTPQACSPGQPWEYAGYSHSLVGIGSSVSLNIQDVQDILAPGGGTVAAWVGVTQYSGQSPINWLQTGMYHAPGGQIVLYIEWYHDGIDDFPYQFVGASWGTDYAASMTHVANQTWTATINGTSVTESLAPTDTEITSEQQNTTSACQPANFKFSSFSPWTTSQMTLAYTPPNNPPYRVTNIAANGWSSIGPNGYNWPQ